MPTLSNLFRIFFIIYLIVYYLLQEFSVACSINRSSTITGEVFLDVFFELEIYKELI